MALGAYVLIDGADAGGDAATVSVFDRGFLYGDSVFETLRTYGGEPFALEEHVDRLLESARRVLIASPLTSEELAAEIRRAVASSGFSESYVRVMLTRGRGASMGLDPALASTPLRVVMVLPLEAPPASKYERGIAAVTYRTQRLGDGTGAAGAKIGNYLTAVLATERARAHGAEEALLVDAEGRVLEGATSNVFGVNSKTLVTAPVELGILSGITRAHLLRIAEDLGITVELRAMELASLWDYDEVFVSSSIRELLAVVRIDGRDVGAGAPGPVFARLLQEFRRRAWRR